MLMQGVELQGPVDFAEFQRPRNAAASSNRFSGRLTLSTETQRNHFVLLVDEFGLADMDIPGMQDLPPFDFEFVQAHGHLIPLDRMPVSGEHLWWEYILEPGPVWDEPGDNGLTRAVIPFSLKERNADCIHNGVMSFLFRDDGAVSKLAVQIVSQTCKYLHFELSALLNITYEPYELANQASVADSFLTEAANRMPQRQIDALDEDYPHANPSNFGSVADIQREDMTVFGFIIDGVHYTGGCATPFGDYPYCNYLALPSYSTAKSLFGGLALMRAEKVFPGTANALISDYVEECDVGWDDVTIENALDMATGRYNSADVHADEDAAIVSEFFIAEDHATKIDEACHRYPKREDAGRRWVYHTSDAYLAGRALANRLEELADSQSDIYNDLIVNPLWVPLGLSPVTHHTRRTNDVVRQPFAGWGLTFHRDDVARIAQFLGADDGRINGHEVFDRRLFDAIKQRDPDDLGLVAETNAIRYNNGFRTRDVSHELGCSSPTWVTLLAGYGGIVIVLMPNDTAYYHFSDGGVHRYMEAIRESHRIRPMC
jgi:hypothetical protein